MKIIALEIFPTHYEVLVCLIHYLRKLGHDIDVWCQSCFTPFYSSTATSFNGNIGKVNRIGGKWTDLDFRKYDRILFSSVPMHPKNLRDDEWKYFPCDERVLGVVHWIHPINCYAAKTQALDQGGKLFSIMPGRPSNRFTNVPLIWLGDEYLEHRHSLFFSVGKSSFKDFKGTQAALSATHLSLAENLVTLVGDIDKKHVSNIPWLHCIQGDRRHYESMLKLAATHRFYLPLMGVNAMMDYVINHASGMYQLFLAQRLVPVIGLQLAHAWQIPEEYAIIYDATCIDSYANALKKCANMEYDELLVRREAGLLYKIKIEHYAIQSLKKLIET